MESIVLKEEIEGISESDVKTTFFVSDEEKIRDTYKISQFPEEEVKSFDLDITSSSLNGAIKNEIFEIDSKKIKLVTTKDDMFEIDQNEIELAMTKSETDQIGKKEIEWTMMKNEVANQERHGLKLNMIKSETVQNYKEEITTEILVTKEEAFVICKEETKSDLRLTKNENFQIVKEEIKLKKKFLIKNENIDIKFNTDKLIVGQKNDDEDPTNLNTGADFNEESFQVDNCPEDVDTYTCAHCKFSSVSKQNLIEHFKIHEPPHLQCAHCSYISRRKTTLRKHLQLKHNFDTGLRTSTIYPPKAVFNCHICGKDYTLLYNLQRHMRISHCEHWPTDAAKNHLNCTYCSFRATRKEVLKKHTNTHEKKRVKCSQCEKSFSRKDLLNKHMIDEHERSQVLECRPCGRTYKTEIRLLQHLGKFGKDHHAGEFQGFKCAICGKVYTKEVSLNAHKRTHLNNSEKPFKCAHCGTGFALLSLLKNHIFPRGLDHIFNCNHCDFTTFNRCLLRQHKGDHENLKVMKCHRCDFQCRNKRKLMIQHLKKKHQH